MKCPKCGYLGFETSDRCRNCGYDFSLGVSNTPSGELPLRSARDEGAPLADFDLAAPARADDASGGLDLDRLIGESPAGAPPRRSRTARTPSPDEGGLPLFSAESEADDTPLITVPRPPRPPLAVRRTTPEVPRGRPRSQPAPPKALPDPAAFEPSADDEAAPAPAPVVPRPTRAVSTAPGLLPPASPAARVLAAGLDLVLLGAVQAAVLYFTLAIAGLTAGDLQVLPFAPLAGFFVLLSGSYLVAFTAAGGQTIGKMATGVRVVSEDGGRVTLPAAVLRAFVCLGCVLTAGLAYAPALVGSDRRGLQDRVAGTRVVGAR